MAALRRALGPTAQAWVAPRARAAAGRGVNGAAVLATGGATMGDGVPVISRGVLVWNLFQYSSRV